MEGQELDEMAEAYGGEVISETEDLDERMPGGYGRNRVPS